MGIEIGAQLDALWRALFLGAAFALLYDGLRALRLRRRTRRALTDLLDALYCLFLAAALLAFTLCIGQGELRLDMLAFIALGAYLRCARGSMAEEKTARKKQGGGTLPKLLLLALLLLIGAHLLNLRQEISRAEAEKQTLSAQLEQQQRENDSLSSALEKADDPEYLQELAREQLDMVSPGEKVFYDVSN